MLQGNLSTRPFYNESLVNLLLVIAAVGGVALAVYNVTQVSALSEERRVFTKVRDDALAEAATINANAERQGKNLDQSAFFMLGAQTQEANSKIDERRFSWTVFFSLMEKTLPLDARLVAVAPRDERGTLHVDLIVEGKTSSDIAAFLDALQQTGSFYDVYTSATQTNDSGTMTETVAASYVAPQSPPSTAAPAAKGKGSAGGGRP